MMLSGMIAWGCERLSRLLESRTFKGGDGSPYLSKYRLLGDIASCPNLVLHRFWRGDEDDEMHDHPWYGLSLILSGGYVEESLAADGRVVVRVLRAGSFNLIRPTRFHRVRLLPDDPTPTWTLFLAGRKRKSWGFKHPVTGAFLPWREFLATKAARLATQRSGP